MFCVSRRGLLPRKKPELQCVLEHRQREQHKQRELALRPPSDLEAKLRTRQQRIQGVSMSVKSWDGKLDSLGNAALVLIYLGFCACASKPADIGKYTILLRRMFRTQMFPVLQYELEEKKRRESLQSVPEFVRVRGTLRRSQTFS